ncbi:uncharacterized protein LOC8039865 [Ixodes scapularis]|uniref:uncharacterized protein LOC8039865 n=1 Tax=Ixodes scapularis TaxID=6945 RepID=UPI001C387F43|nr:uncharacterized protein LOC8039865 [Ixodes scapularis]
MALQAAKGSSRKPKEQMADELVAALPACSLEQTATHSLAEPADCASHCATCVRCNMTTSLLRLQRSFDERGIELLADCTTDCWLNRQLDILNNILCNVIMSLERRTPGTLSLLTLTSLKSSEMNVDANQALALLLVLLQLHGCIEELDFEDRHAMGPDVLTVLPAGISKSWRLKCLNLRISTPLPAGLGQWLRFQTVRCFGLSNVVISAQEAEEWSLFVDSCPSLQRVVLSLNYLDEMSSCAVLTGLSRASKLTELTIKNNRLGVKGLQTLSRALKERSILTSLTLWNCDLSAKHMEPLADVVAEGCTINTLDLSCNFRIGDEGIKCLSECLHKNRTLKRLCLTNVGLSSDIGCGSLGALLAANTTIECLNLSENHINDIGIACMAAGLESNATLKTLILESVRAGADSVVVLADVVLAKSGRLRVRLGKVKVAGADSIRLALKLKNNRAREHLEVFWDSNSVANLVDMLNRCTHMDELTLPDITFERGATGSPNCFSTLFEGLCASDNVRALTVTNADSVGSEEAFSKYLSRTRTLEKLRFLYGAIVRTDNHIMAGLVDNLSLREVHFGDSLFASSSALAEVLHRNSTLEVIKFYHFEVEELGMTKLIINLKSNTSLVRFETNPGCIPPKFYFRFHDLLRRNWDLLVCAVAFVLYGVQDRASAEAFEGKRHSAELQAKVASLGMVSKEEAGWMIRRAEFRRRSEFFLLAGVVRKDLRCLPTASGQPQLENLGEVLCEIASYLSISDVRGGLTPLRWTVPASRCRQWLRR